MVYPSDIKPTIFLTSPRAREPRAIRYLVKSTGQPCPDTYSIEMDGEDGGGGIHARVKPWWSGGSYTVGAIVDVLTVASGYLLRPWDTVGAIDITKFAFMARSARQFLSFLPQIEIEEYTHTHMHTGEMRDTESFRAAIKSCGLRFQLMEFFHLPGSISGRLLLSTSREDVSNFILLFERRKFVGSGSGCACMSYVTLWGGG